MTNDIIVLPNDPLKKLDNQTDLFGLLPKAHLIKNILTNHIIEDKKIKMVALYGHWGSGKTSLMNHIIKELENKYITILFEAWQLERDTNLALSLLEQLLDIVIENGGEFKKVLLRTGRILFTLGKNLASSTTIDITPVKLDVGKAFEKTQKELDDFYERKSYYAVVQEFKAEFIKLEEKLKKDKKKIIIFIDDLDRCEPENVLNLLSAIKLFFTYSSNIVYFCGVDKNAVSAAIKTKYQSIINHEDYLEKIFDISFNMPKHYDIAKILKKYFPQKDESFIDDLQGFLNSIEFDIPRHLIKALNKYSLLKQYKKIDKSLNNALIPDINEKEHILTVIFTLYIIILFEFFQNSFKVITNYEEKFNGYIQSSYEAPLKSKDAFNENNAFFTKYIKNIKNVELNDSSLNISFSNPEQNCLFNILTLFTPQIIGKYSRANIENDLFYYLNQFENSNDRILTSFCRYLIKLGDLYKSKKLDMNGFKSIKIFDLLKMAQLYL